MVYKDWLVFDLYLKVEVDLLLVLICEKDMVECEVVKLV